MIAAPPTPRITLPQVAQFAQGDLVVPEVPPDPVAREAFLRSGVSGASIDTRTLQAGELFVPLQGASTNGHDFIAQAFTRGAAASLCERDHYERFEGREPGPLVLVENATIALILIAHRYRDSWPGLMIGITGSTGKTTTRELVASAFETTARTLRTQGNLNNHWGVPLTLMRLTPEHEVAVVEMAMNAPGEIDELTRISAPRAGIITNAGRAHLERFGTVEAIAHEKAALARSFGAHQVVFAGADSPALMAALKDVKCRVVTYGLSERADVHPTGIEDLGPAGMRFSVDGFPDVHLRLIGRHQVANALAAIAVAREYRLDPVAVARVLGAHRPGHGRMELRRAGGATFLVDCYNANPDATVAALETLAGWPGAERRIAVLGDMLELGENAVALHRETGSAVRGADLWSVGAFADAYAAGAADAGAQTRVFGDKAAVRAALEEALGPGLVVLVKASRGSALEDVLPDFDGEDSA